MPIAFDANTGQFADDVRFLVHGRDSDLVLGDEASLVVHSQRTDGSVCVAKVELTLPPHAAPIGEHPLATRTSYFLGNDPARWRADVPSFASVTYPAKGATGVSVRFHGSDDARLEYDLAVPAHTDLSALSIGIRGGYVLIADDAVVVETPCGELVQRAPTVFRGASRRPVHAAYRMTGRDRIGFDVEADDGEDILIDPTLVFSTLLPGADSSLAIANDAKGQVYVAGYTWQTSFPVTNAYQSSLAGNSDVWIAKFAGDGSSLLYATYLGGSGSDGPQGLAVDALENVYVVGSASADFPNVNAFQTKPSGAFVTKLAASGSSLVYSSFLGGSTFDVAWAVAVDGSGAAYVGGETGSSDFPVTAGAYQSAFNGGTVDAFVAKVNSAGTALDYATFLGGSNWDYVRALAVDSNGNAYMTGTTQSSNFPTHNAAQPSYGGGGYDGFVTKISANGTSVGYSTYLGGSNNDYGVSLAVDGNGDAYIVGPTQSSDLPIKNAYQSSLSGPGDAFITKYDPSGAIVSSTYLGGSGYDAPSTVALVSTGDVVVFGGTGSADFPIKNAMQSTLAGGSDCYVSRFDSSISSLLSSTYLGGSGGDNANAMSVDSAKTVYLTGIASSGFPLRNALFTTGGVFVAKMGTLTISPSAVTIPPKGSQTFTASDGSGSGYTFALISNSSGGSITSNGVYAAGPKGNVTDVVQLTDSASTTATATVTIGPNLAVVPPAPSTPPNGTIAFTATGGGGSGYLWSLASNNSGATIGNTTGKYTAGATGNVVDTVMVADPLGNSSTAIVVVGSGVSIVPAAPSVPPNGSITFSATGGSGLGYAWTLTKNASGATIDSSSGAYKAGGLAKTVDTVRVDDSFGNGALVNVSVGDGLAIDPAAPKSPPRGSVQLVAIGGAGSQYAWHLDTNASGGSIDVTSGLYVAGAMGNVSDVVSVVDPLANAATVTIAVGPGIQISPLSVVVAPDTSVPFVATGGDGKGYRWSLSGNASGGAIDEDSGVYTAGATEGADQVHVIDSLGNTGEALALVSPPDAGIDAGTAPSVSGGCSCRSVGRSRPGVGDASLIGLVFALLRRRRSREAA